MLSNTIPNNALILINSQAFEAAFFRNHLAFWLDHYGVPSEMLDVSGKPLPDNLRDYPLIILGHPGLDGGGTCQALRDLSPIRSAVELGSGLMSFDPHISCALFDPAAGSRPLRSLREIEVISGHTITERYAENSLIQFLSPMDLAGIPGCEPGEKLIVEKGGDLPLMSVQSIGQGRAVHWATGEWMRSAVLGPLGGLDSAFWRSLVWAARKPFCLRGFPPVVTMRVDDVAGRGGLWQRSPLYWVEDAVSAGFKPWLGLFIYNLDGPTIAQLREQILSGRASAFPHAFGRPPRDGNSDNLYYHPDSIPLRAESYDEFIYFDHIKQSSYPDPEAARGLAAVDAWYSANAPLPISKCALPHWYEMGSNTARHVREVWGCEFLGKVMDFDRPLAAGIPWLRSGPFRENDETGECLPHTADSSGHRPVYYADFVETAGVRFFNSATEIRDDAGYEWAPDNDVMETIRRAGRQMRRALDAMALASLFTHETDFIYKIEPDRWTAIIQGAAEEIALYQPWQMTLDDAMGLLRETRSSSLRRCALVENGKEIQVTFEGRADRATYFYLFGEGEGRITGEILEVPAFEGALTKTIPL